MTEQDGPKPDQINIPAGLSALYLPELADKNQFGDTKLINPEEVLARTNAFLAELTSQGVEVKAVIPVQVAKPPRAGVIGQSTETKQMIIVNR